MRARPLTLIALVIALSGGLAFAGPPTRVEVSGLRVRVGDVIRNAPAEAADVDLGPSPAAGGSRLIDREQILSALRAHGETSGLRVPEAVRVVRRVTSLTPGDLDRMVRDALPAARLPRGATIAAVRAPRSVDVPSGWSAVSADIPRPPRRAGSFATTAVVTLRAGEEIVARITVPVELALSAEAATPDLVRGATVTLLVRQGLVEVRASGNAGADANVGEPVPVVLRPSGRVLRARLIERDVALALEGP